MLILMENIILQSNTFVPAASALPPNFTVRSRLAGLSLFRGGDGTPATAGRPTNLTQPIELFIPLLSPEFRAATQVENSTGNSSSVGRPPVLPHQLRWVPNETDLSCVFGS
jgi:hypothetical protein